ncbi:hypothetical protein AHMF7605_24315 [Adhaeribacter arboris]|uniref:Tetratricopeptide repeat protein n=1 Tax=Adhaeribacter arboris TaxID=2072846 RepID=A0A2T2YLN3_9BACT|nr:tetratricopeptide repeat protein [Adhaeribacter arboris]PSR56399.1 hypothetical protein AHMF7605_24315 [Adhaeribacter arboris]
MMEDFNKEELIEKYLLGQLHGEALVNFKHRLVTDEALKKEVALEQAILRNLKTVGKRQTLLQFENFHQELEQETYTYQKAAPELNIFQKLEKILTEKLTGLTGRQYAFIAASVVFIIASTLTINTILTKQSSPETIYQAYYEPYPIETFRGEATGTALKTEAVVAYNRGDYSQSIRLFEQFLAKEKDEKSLFYLGNAYLAAERPEDAIKTYLAYLQQYHQFEMDAKWYLSLSYMKVGQFIEARNQLRELTANTNPDNIYREKAEKILSKQMFKKLPE